MKSIQSMSKHWYCTAVVLLASSTWASEAPKTSEPKTRVDCTPAREYVTTLEYLRDVKELAIKEDDARKLASRVSGGCNGAARRFIRVSQTLIKSGLASNNAVTIATGLALRTDRETETFLTIFNQGFLPEHLDLSLGESVRMASALTIEFNGNTKMVFKDFEKALNYCLGEKYLNLSRPQCGDLAVKVAKLGENYDGDSAKAFIESYEFARSSKGPALDVQPSVELALNITAHGPKAYENFAQAYQYATSKSGLALELPKAIGFAKDLSSKSSKLE